MAAIFGKFISPSSRLGEDITNTWHNTNTLNPKNAEIKKIYGTQFIRHFTGSKGPCYRGSILKFWGLPTLDFIWSNKRKNNKIFKIFKFFGLVQAKKLKWQDFGPKSNENLGLLFISCFVGI